MPRQCVLFDFDGVIADTERRLLGNSYEDGTIQPMPGLVDFVRGLRAAGVKTGLVSSTSARLILAALDHMGMMALFDVILCGDMVERTKPDPTCYQKAMAFWAWRRRTASSSRTLP